MMHNVMLYNTKNECPFLHLNKYALISFSWFPSIPPPSCSLLETTAATLDFPQKQCSCKMRALIP